MIRAFIFTMLLSSSAFAQTLPNYFPMNSIDLTGRFIVALDDLILPGNGILLYTQDGYISSYEKDGLHCTFQAEPEDSPNLSFVKKDEVYKVTSFEFFSKTFRDVKTDPNCRAHQANACVSDTSIVYQGVLHMIVESAEGTSIDIDCFSTIEDRPAVRVSLLKQHLGPHFNIDDLIKVK